MLTDARRQLVARHAGGSGRANGAASDRGVPDGARCYTGPVPFNSPEAKAAARQRRRDRNKAIVLALKDGPCVDCGASLPPACMDFDHVRDTFQFWIGNGDVDCSEQRLRREIAKCDLRCPNCHRLRHYAADGRWGAPTCTGP